MSKRSDFAVDILGSQWRVLICTAEDEPRLNSSVGFCDWTSRKICVEDWNARSCSLEDLYEFTMKIIRHEIIHAFMFESGLGDDWEHQTGHDETIIDWLAYQFPKIEAVISAVEEGIDWDDD